MSKVRINDLARELEVKSREILDTLTAVGVTEKKTHSSSLESDEAERVRAYLKRGSRGASETQSRSAGNGQKPKIDWSQVSKPGDAARELLRRKEEAAAAAASPRPAVPAAAPAPPPVAAKPAPSQPTPPQRPAVAVEAAASVAPRKIVPQPRQEPRIVVAPPPSIPAIAAKPPTGPVIARPPLHAAGAQPQGEPRPSTAAGPVSAPVFVKPSVHEAPAPSVSAPPVAITRAEPVASS